MTSTDASTAVVAVGEHPLGGTVLSAAAVDFLVALERRFRHRRAALLAAREERQVRLESGELPEFPPESAAVRAGEWTVAAIPSALADRRVELVGPTDEATVRRALGSGASTYIADFEDAATPSWDNVVRGQAVLRRAARGELRGGGARPTLIVRPRGWHLDERHVLVDGAAMSASLFDFGCYCFHNASVLSAGGAGAFFYLPKLEGHLEARLWREVLDFAEERLGLATGTIRVSVLIESVLAAFEMDEILFELRTRACALSAGRWDYLFSFIKKLGHDRRFLLPDRARLTMEVPFLAAYTRLLVETCHRRGAYAVGGQSAAIPDEEIPGHAAAARAEVDSGARREAAVGFDGTWVAHEALVPPALAAFADALGGALHQIGRPPSPRPVTPADLLTVGSAEGAITREGLWRNVSVGIRYLDAWLAGHGAVAIDGRMEDTATAEICRAQLWQWVRHRVLLEDGTPVTRALVQALADAEMARLSRHEHWQDQRLDRARALFEKVSTSPKVIPFLTLPAYAELG